MNRESSQEDSNLNQGKTKEKELNENLKFMRSVIERTHREFDPGAPIFICWGVLCLIGYTGAHFLIAQQMYVWINRMWYALYAVGIPFSIFYSYRMENRQFKLGSVSHISKQIGRIWMILVLNGIVFGTFGLGRNFLGDIHFFWAWIYALGLSMTGIVYSKEWLIAGIGVFVGILAAVFIKPYAYIILGIAMCIGCVVPSIIAMRRLRRLEKADGQV